MPIKRNETTGITDFSKARVGDKVFDRFIQEYGNIKYIKHNTQYGFYIISVEFKHITDQSYTINGLHSNAHKIPALVWAEQKPEDDWSILPEMPKRMVKKKIEGWMNIHSTPIPKAVGFIYKTIEEAIKHRSNECLGEPLFISHEYEEYEVEDD